ncbi:odorant receptor 46a-like [Zophobas morio]|uniref:odorant receptor 46a-like n=1 Tax=Zophobas morio TaxID=2755281 RepID=UPI0030838137
MKKYDWKETIKGNLFMLKILGLWPAGVTYNLDLYSTYACVSTLVLTCGHNFFQIINIYFIFPDLAAIADTIFVTLSEILAAMKTYHVLQNMQVLKKLMLDINEDYFQPRNSAQIKMIESSLNFWKKTSTIFWSMGSGAVFFWAVYPILDGSVKENRLPFLAWYPYNTTISPLYEITYVYQIISVAFIASTSLAVGTLIAALNVFIGAQCDILCDNLKYSVKGRSVVPFSSEFFSLLMFEIGVLVEIFMFCWFANEVEIKSANIPLAIFHSEWLKITDNFKQDISFFLMRSQKSIKISALGLFYLSLDTFVKVSILRTSWSYFALLNQFSA